MEEADLLGDKIGIMKKGTLRYVRRQVYFRSRYRHKREYTGTSTSAHFS
jgi:hypothetical protein